MPLRGLLKKKDKLTEDDAPVAEAAHDVPDDGPVFTFMRTDTHTQEIISPPTFSSAESSSPPSFADGNTESRTSRLFKRRNRSSSVASAASVSSRASSQSKPKSPNSKTLSQRLHLKRSETRSASVPNDLPKITIGADGDGESGAGAESQWEKRATMLAKKNEEQRSRPNTPVGSVAGLYSFKDMKLEGIPAHEKGVVSTKQVDDNIQEAIKLHESGDLANSTRMFGRLADPNGENNALSQVLYGLALRYVHWPFLCSPYHFTSHDHQSAAVGLR
jgi:hypothetical protein